MNINRTKRRSLLDKCDRSVIWYMGSKIPFLTMRIYKIFFSVKHGSIDAQGSIPSHSDNVQFAYGLYFQNTECYFERVLDLKKCAGSTCIIVSVAIFKTHRRYTSYIFSELFLLIEVFEVFWFKTMFFDKLVSIGPIFPC